MKYKDQDILKAIKNRNDHKALEALYRSIFPKIRNLVNSGGDKEEEAKDILQEALLIFYKQVMTNRFDEKYEIEGFIYSISRNLWINRIKKKNRTVNLDKGELPDVPEPSAMDELELKERKKVVRDLFNKLDEKCKELLTYSLFDELSMKEISEKMGFTSPNAATVASFRCKKYLIELAKKNKLTQII